MEKVTLAGAMEYSRDRFTKRVLFQKGGSVMFVLNFMPGQALPVHAHPGSELFLTVLEGSGTLTIDERNTTVTAGDAVHCGGEERFSFSNDSDENVSLLVVLSKLPNEQYARNV
ncbi:cupin domain-containing protein [Paenibacillus antri]|uniref:Cupin domain-containing protein n=1 Tax=Paenibacillus antri TaxID=2582848 RepID=A0A5R9GHS4_9BACL|nr:cupin domain-containing protein [Paenibacillus antri]TLS52343.1 cupin domain-containing protein [Paenibacillus antri]